ncbi:MAG: type III toxin-antitoxin system ToxN/AbiQ family toxin, partial [Clostridiales bacterium]|nr:type III toxin-antitoxin system ToxN/AbiQ family toxin [Clostridiales bacterium]
MNLSFYRADAGYCDFLRETDPCVPYTQDKKDTRPFVGVLLSVCGINYFAPLTSPKSKHLAMKNQVDFLKINDGVWGAINFNNMIPIHMTIPFCERHKTS